MTETRAYRMRARAERAARTRDRVLSAAMTCFGEEDYETVSLKKIAREAGVGLQTVVRTAGSKEGLFALVAERFLGEMLSTFTAAGPRTWREAVRQVLGFLEEYGDRLVRIQAHEVRVAEVAEYASRSRAMQRAWIEANAGAWFDAMSEEERERRLAMILTLTGSRTWFVLRRIHGLTAEQTRLAVEEQLEPLLPGDGES